MSGDGGSADHTKGHDELPEGVKADADDPVDETTDETTSTALRWQYTNDVIAGGYLLAYLLLTALDGVWVVNLSALPTGWRLAAWLIAVTAAAWAFGGAALKAAAGALKK